MSFFQGETTTKFHKGKVLSTNQGCLRLFHLTDRYSRGEQVGERLNLPLQRPERRVHTHHGLTNANGRPRGTALMLSPFAFIFTKWIFKVHLEEQTSGKSPASVIPSTPRPPKESREQWKRLALLIITTDSHHTQKQYGPG